MIAQAYYKDKELTVRIFENRNSQMIAELPLGGATDKDANLSLRRIGLVRRHPWIDYGHMKEAQVRFRVRKRNGD